MRTKRLLPIAAGFLAAVLLFLNILYAHHRAEAATDAPAASPAVSVATARIGFIAHQLMVAGVFQAFQEIDFHGKVSGYMPSSISQEGCIGGARC
jgi:hypothetical protein